MTGADGVPGAVDRYVDDAHGWAISIPSRTADGEAVIVEQDVPDGRHRIHAQTTDASTVYVELVSSADRVPHAWAIGEQRAALRERSPDAAISEGSPTQLAGRPATAFTFDGRIGADHRRRRFVFVDTPAGTLRVVHDPTSPANDAILATLAIAEEPA